MSNLDALFSSKTDQWSTPIDFFKKLDDEFHFTLDPCADESNHKCEKYFTKEDDGLSKNWGGTGFSVIHHTAERLENGLRSVMRKVGKRIRLLLC